MLGPDGFRSIHKGRLEVEAAAQHFNSSMENKLEISKFSGEFDHVLTTQKYGDNLAKSG